MHSPFIILPPLHAEEENKGFDEMCVFEVGVWRKIGLDNSGKKSVRETRVLEFECQLQLEFEIIATFSKGITVITLLCCHFRRRPTHAYALFYQQKMGIALTGTSCA